jgi:hypothetical protein
MCRIYLETKRWRGGCWGVGARDKLADLVVQTAQRTQLIVTTHSDLLVDAMTDRPEAVVVCEKHEGKTELRRLEKAELTPWLEKYRLGQLWTRGQIGGTRW